MDVEAWSTRELISDLERESLECSEVSRELWIRVKRIEDRDSDDGVI